jgi:sugar phosphate isomerase/epimerase
MVCFPAMNRRTFLEITGAALPLAYAATLQGQTKKIPVGLELYSVRTEYTRNLEETVTRVAKMGYEVVEFWNPYTQWTPERAKEVRKLLDDLGIKCLSTHNSGTTLIPDNYTKLIELNQIIGSRAIIQASEPAPRPRTIAEWKTLGDRLTAFAERLRPLGMATGYHNHALEWPLLEGQRPMDVILQFDVGTCVEAGADPIAWINANPGRIKSVHCKDWGAGPGRGYSVAFGEGDAPWKRIFDAVESVGGIEYYLIEQEVAGAAGQFAMAEKCMENWKKLRA